MFKGKIKIWIMILIACVVLQNVRPVLSHIVVRMAVNLHVTAQSNVKSDNNFVNLTNGTSFGDSTINYKDSGDFDIIIEDGGASDKTGYVHYKNYFYSPLVMYVRSKVTDNTTGFSKASGYNPTSIDLTTVLEAMEEGKKWEELGVHDSVLGGTIKLTIPNERTFWYPQVVELFYYALNNYNVPTTLEREQLAPRVETLLNKCEKISDIAQAIRDDYNNPTTFHKAFIGPEYLYIRGDRELRISNRNSYFPVYFPSTVAVTLDLFTKQIEGSVDRTGIIYDENNKPNGKYDVGTRLKYNFEKNNTIFVHVGYRVLNMEFDITKEFGYTSKTVDYITLNH